MTQMGLLRQRLSPEFRPKLKAFHELRMKLPEPTGKLSREENGTSTTSATLERT